jgi:hypothetical protein
LVALHLAHPDARAADARLDEERQGEPPGAGEEGRRVALEIGAARGLGVHHRHAGGGELALREELVHGQRAGRHARAGVGDVEHLAEALERAVLPPGAVDDREEHLDAGGHEVA